MLTTNQVESKKRNIMKKRNINKLGMMKSINKRLIKAKLKHYKNTKKKKQEYDLDMKTKMPKCMASAFFFRLKFRTIDLITNC